MSTLSAEDVRALIDAVARLQEQSVATEQRLHMTQTLLAEQSDRVDRLLREVAADRRATEIEQRITRRLQRYARTDLPILVGPWTGDATFELLYWIPFLQWIRETFAIDPDRLMVVSRGGVAPWYAHVTSRYADVLEHAAIGELRNPASVDRRQQLQIRPFDRRVIRHVMRARELRQVHLLHPALMFALHRVAVRQGRLDPFLRFKALDLPADAPAPPLPERFVAVRFSFNDSFPETSENRWIAASVISALAARGDVVLLNAGILGEDGDFAPEQLARVHVLGDEVRPEQALAVQTAVIRRADAFVGTYGTEALLAPLVGVSSLAVYSKRGFPSEDLALAQRIFPALGPARLTAVEVGQADLLSNALRTWTPAHGLTSSPDDIVALLRVGLQALSWPDRFQRLAIAEKRASSRPARAAILNLRDELAATALAELAPGWGDLPLKESILRLDAKSMSAALQRGARDLRDRHIVELVTSGRSKAWQSAPLAGIGVGLDERVLELPFALDAAALDRPGEVLDAGSALNLPVVRAIVGRPAARVTHFTQSDESEPVLPGDEDKFVFSFGDLREMPYADGTFDRAVCISTLEHVGMDNLRYGGALETDPASAVRAVGELLRVIVAGGELLLTVPYGRRRANEYFRVFDAGDLQALLAPAAAEDVSTRYFYYQSGWTEGGAQPPAAILDVEYGEDVVTGIAVTRIRRQRTER